MLMGLSLPLVIVRRLRLLSIERAVSAECDGRAEALPRSPIPCARSRRIDPAHRPTFRLGEQRLQPPGDLGLRRHADDAIDFPSVPEQITIAPVTSAMSAPCPDDGNGQAVGAVEPGMGRLEID